MPLEIGALLFEGVKKIVFTAISKRVVFAGESFLTKRKVESRIDDSIAQVIEQLVPFFYSEHLTDHKRQVLISNCTHELSEILEDPKEAFAASLDGQKMFDRRYADGKLPQGIREEGLEDLYALVFPQIANLICAYPPAIEQWKIEGYRDGFRRLDEIATTLGGVANKLDQLASRDLKAADVLLNRVRQSLAQRVEFQLDLTGLRGDRPDAVPLEKCFIVPELLRTVEDPKTKQKKEIRIGHTAEILFGFSATSVRAVVVGAPGSGKSTWSRWLQRQQLTSDAERIAILVRLRDLVKGSILPSLQQLVREAAGTHLREEVNADIARGWCSAGAVTFILDGFDEIPPNRREEVFSWICELDCTTERAGLILTSRPLTTNHLDRLPAQWLAWELLPFDELRITNYISNWYAYAPLLVEKQREIDAKALSKKWINDFALQPLIGTPLMLTTIVMVHHMDGELPKGRSRLYERYVNGMLGLWDSRWGVPSAVELPLDLKHRILTALAVHLHMANIEQLGDEEIKGFIETVLPTLGCGCSAAEVLDYLRERTGLLIGPGTWSFVHKNVGEFLVAAAIRDGDCVTDDGQKLDRLRLFAERHNDRWNNVLFFWAGLTAPGDLQGFIEQVSEELEANEVALAISLFYDQLQPHRLTEPWRTTQLTKLLQRDFRDRTSSAVAFVCGPVPKSVRLEVQTSFPTFRLPERTNFRSVIWECLKFSSISWRDGAQFHKSALFIVWTFFATRPRSIDDLRAAINEKTWTREMDSTWLLYPATWGLSAAALGTIDVCLTDFVAELNHSSAELKHRMVFFLLGALIDVGAEHSINNSRDNLQELLVALETIKDEEIDPEWLQLSRKFVEHSIGPIPSFDLLRKSQATLDRAELVQGIDSELVSKVRVHLRKLITLRDHSVKTTKVPRRDK